MYNQLIDDGALVTMTEVDLEDVGMLGTPEQVADFLKTPPLSAADLALWPA
jgi:hypothetical protein